MPLVPNTVQGSEAWRAARLGKVTASLAAACLGLNPYTSRQAAYRIILGIEPYRSNHHMERGIEFESQAIVDYQVETGEMVEPTGFWIHPTLPWLGASPDGLIGADGLLQVKCPEVIKPEIAEMYIVQVQIEMLVTQRSWCDLWQWAQHDHSLTRVHANAALQVNLFERLQDFYRAHLVPPFREPARAKRKAKPGCGPNPNYIPDPTDPTEDPWM